MAQIWPWDSQITWKVDIVNKQNNGNDDVFLFMEI